MKREWLPPAKEVRRPEQWNQQQQGQITQGNNGRRTTLWRHFQKKELNTQEKLPEAKFYPKRRRRRWIRIDDTTPAELLHRGKRKRFTRIRSSRGAPDAALLTTKWQFQNFQRKTIRLYHTPPRIRGSSEKVVPPFFFWDVEGIFEPQNPKGPWERSWKLKCYRGSKGGALARKNRKWTHSYWAKFPRTNGKQSQLSFEWHIPAISGLNSERAA